MLCLMTQKSVFWTSKQLVSLCFRNILVHAYDVLDDEEVYFFVVTDIQVLLKEASEKL